MRTAIFPGSFDPFTIGHKDIVERALPLFDRIVIGIGINDKKSAMISEDERIRTIEQVFAGDPRISVVSYHGLTVDFARENNAEWIIRGVRSTIDFEYEKSIAEANKQLSGIETLLLYTRPEYAHISSSLARDLLKHGKDISALLP